MVVLCPIITMTTMIVMRMTTTGMVAASSEAMDKAKADTAAIMADTETGGLTDHSVP